MLIEGIKSRPQYETLALDPTGTSHLLLAESENLPDEDFVDGFGPFASVETWAVVRSSLAIPGPVDFSEETPKRLLFRSTDHMLDLLARRLSTERMGLRVYAVGTEKFLWDVFAVARDAGLGRQEVHLCHRGSQNRRVYCTHCRAINDGVTCNVFACRGCGANLLVRDHFSRRLSAFMGVQVDAEAPGELPDIQEIYR